jgi:hypothetical protein
VQIRDVRFSLESGHASAWTSVACFGYLRHVRGNANGPSGLKHRGITSKGDPLMHVMAPAFTLALSTLALAAEFYVRHRDE